MAAVIDGGDASGGVRTITFVATASSQGEDLARAVTDLVGRGSAALTVLREPTQTQVFHAIVRSDVAILDATVEPAGGSNYPAFTAQPLAMPHVLVVSRTPLPPNFHGLREGGAPPYPHESDNATILGWIADQLEALLAEPRRSRLERTSLGSVVTTFRGLWGTMASGPARRRAFVSYRSTVFEEARRIEVRLPAGDGGLVDGPRDVTLLGPGELAFENELLAARLRWHLVSLLEERLRRCQAQCRPPRSPAC